MASSCLRCTAVLSLLMALNLAFEYRVDTTNTPSAMFVPDCSAVAVGCKHLCPDQVPSPFPCQPPAQNHGTLGSGLRRSQVLRLVDKYFLLASELNPSCVGALRIRASDAFSRHPAVPPIRCSLGVLMSLHKWPLPHSPKGGCYSTRGVRVSLHMHSTIYLMLSIISLVRLTIVQNRTFDRSVL